jgi:hypothetical protein
MSTALAPFNDVLGCLEDARIKDEKIHSRPASLRERTASHDALLSLRAEMAEIRATGGFEPICTSGLHDSRTRRGARLG